MRPGKKIAKGDSQPRLRRRVLVARGEFSRTAGEFARAFVARADVVGSGGAETETVPAQVLVATVVELGRVRLQHRALP